MAASASSSEEEEDIRWRTPEQHGQWLEEMQARRTRLAAAEEEKRLFDLQPAQQRFLLAVVYGQFDEVEAFLENPGEVDVNGMWGSFDSALEEAVVRGHERVVQSLLEHGADVSAVNSKWQRGNTALHMALLSPNHKRYERIVRALLLHGADVNKHGRGGFTPVHYAVRYASSAIVKILLNHGADISRRDEGGYNAMHAVGLRTHGSTAVQNKICRMLLDNGSDVRFKLAVLLQKSSPGVDGDDFGFVPARGFVPQMVADLMEKYDIRDMMIDAEDQYVEQIEAVESADLAREEARRYVNKTAFAMGHHARLGANSPLKSLAPEMLEMIFRHV
jgi:ankyrin repeat protein